MRPLPSKSTPYCAFRLMTFSATSSWRRVEDQLGPREDPAVRDLPYRQLRGWPEAVHHSRCEACADTRDGVVANCLERPRIDARVVGDPVINGLVVGIRGARDLDQCAVRRPETGARIARDDGQVAGPEAIAPPQRLAGRRGALQRRLARRRRRNRRRARSIWSGAPPAPTVMLTGCNGKLNARGPMRSLASDIASHRRRRGLAEAHAGGLDVALEGIDRERAGDLRVAAGGGGAGMKIPQRGHPEHHQDADQRDRDADDELNQAEAVDGSGAMCGGRGVHDRRRLN